MRDNPLASRLTFVGLGLCVLMAVPNVLVGQEITGRLRVADPRQPIAGVVVTASRAGDGVLVGRTLTGSRGEFRLAVTADSLVIRALRVGQRPAILARVRVASGDVYRVETELPYDPVALSLVRTLATDRCQLRGSGGDVVAELFFAARTAILAAGATSVDAPSRSAYRLVSEQRNARGQPVDSLREEEVQLTEALLPFRSLSADSLLAGGWVSSRPDGGTVFRALDAEVLLDDRFLTRYCLQLVSDSSTPPDVIGVAFHPAESRRGRADVKGVLWFDLEHYALRALEFRYIGLDAISMGTDPGGTIEFASLPNGVWFVSAWSMRMPVVGRRVQLRSGARFDAPPVISERRALIGRRSLHAEVLWVETGRRLQFMRPWPLLAADTRSVASKAAPGLDAVDSANNTMSCWLHGRLLTTGGSPLAASSVEVLDHGRAGAVGEPRLLDVTRTDEDGRFRLCPEAGPRALMIRTHVGDQGIDSVVIAPMNSIHPHAVTLLRGEGGFEVPPMHANHLVGAVNARFDIAPMLAESEVDGADAGDTAEAARPMAGETTAARMVPHAVGETAVAERDDVVAAGQRVALGTAAGAWLAVIDSDSISIPFATVTLRGGERRVTAADGRVPLPRTVRGEIELDVRRIGYAPFSARVAPDARDGVYRVQLAPAEQNLAVVEVIAPRATALSRTGFYDRAERVRRGAIVGAFMTPEEIEGRPFGTAANLLAGMQYVWAVSGRQPTGRGGCAYQVLVDGLPATIPLSQITANEVMGVEVYPSTANAPVELIPVTDRGSCGIIAIWLGPRR